MALTIAVILGSVRAERLGIRAARFITQQLSQQGHDVHLVDPVELALPLLDKMFKEYPEGNAPAPLQALAGLYRRADAFVIVSGEYNHSIPPALSNTLDHFLEEYFWRPSAIVSYSSGRFGGVRAAMQLRAMLAELGMPSIPSLLPIGDVAHALAEDGTALDPKLVGAASRFVAELAWYAEALKRQRASGTPY